VGSGWMRKEGFYATNGSGRYLSPARSTRTAPVLQSRLLRALLVVTVTVAVELVLWQLFVRRSYWRELFLPVAGGVALIAAFALWRVLRPRSREDRRDGDRRLAKRRDDQP
jgi:hypothetical protein